MTLYILENMKIIKRSVIIIALKKKIVNDEITTDDNHIYKCTQCGAEHDAPVGHFYKVTFSQLWNSNDKYCPICVTCLKKNFEKISRTYESDRVACKVLCAYIDVPFYNSLYDTIVTKNSTFSIGHYMRQINGNRQYQYKTFLNTLVDGELEKTVEDITEEKEQKWEKSEIVNKNEVVKIVGYDPFEGYTNNDRRFLFNELVKYFDDDIQDDTYKLSQIIQVVNNNNQIRRYDLLINSLNPISNSNDIKGLNELKSKLVMSNDKIAKENEISVKNRSNKDIGKSTLTYLMKDLREKDFKKAETNYYDQLKSEGTLWAMDMSLRAIKQNGMFDENDKEEIFEIQRGKLIELQDRLNEELEKNRLLNVEIYELKSNKDDENE